MTEERRGLLAGLAAWVIWGLFPLYWRSLAPSTPFELLAHRVVWAVVWVALVLLVIRRWHEVLAAFRDRRTALVLVAASIAIGVNWGMFIYGVNVGRTVEVSLGYYVNPLVSVLLGVWFFSERLRPLQWAAIAIAAVAVIVLTIEVGQFPWLGLSLAASFGVYGLLKKISPTPPLSGLMVEALILLPASVAFLAYLMSTGTSTFGHHGALHVVLIVLMGLVTAVPLVLFAVSAQSIPLSTLGLMQYITPTMQFLLGVVVFGEPMSAARWTGFAIVWAALIVFSVDALHNAHRERRTRADEMAVTPEAI
ncbi:EamA family transporter RarD [Cumulibacter manganitolerans]|uniref:EamA family transporter RarD n=1 Tax=Cumulibacter manganitolerans TaxID=1884992 RepID=UPI001294F686|nr:EamA family transporter RarD [Cumulibacter manganitolerans]